MNGIARHAQDTVTTLLSDFLHAGETRSVQIVLERTRLDEQVVTHILLQSGPGYEVVVAAVYLSVTWWPRRTGHNAAESIWMSHDQFIIDPILQSSKHKQRSNVGYLLLIYRYVRENGLINHG
ncbi:hypothetical protein PENTCL1PPCAC_24763, partial [Pristionchus entomophagus]